MNQNLYKVTGSILHYTKVNYNEQRVNSDEKFHEHAHETPQCKSSVILYSKSNYRPRWYGGIMTDTNPNAKILTFSRAPFWRMALYQEALNIAEAKRIEIGEKMGVFSHFFSF